jgi:type II secretory ATPase GspE/PulE/Tfp pilus assembly ATPase PilB-like protein
MGANELQQMRGSILALSAADGQYPLPPADQGKMCLTSDGKLYVGESYKIDHVVMAYVELLRRAGHRFTTEYVPVDQVHLLYASAVSSEGTGNRTFRQREVVALLGKALKMRASDIHFRNYANHTDVLIRVDGDLEKFETFRAEDGNAYCATIYGSMCDVAEQTYEPAKAQDARVKREYVEAVGLYGARVATRPTDGGNLMVMRLLEKQDRISDLAELGYLAKQIADTKRMIGRTTGINIFSGPTGSGKSRSLQALLSMLLAMFHQKIHLLTIEDPPENAIVGAVQTPIIADRKDPEAVYREWARSISNAMRLDPDVMMVGEIVDANSAMAAFRAAITGHGLWTTLHASDVMKIFDRLLDLGVPLNLLCDASNVTGLINQSLVALNCSCKRPYSKFKSEVDPELRERIERYCDPQNVFLRGADKACPHCGGKGYFKRTVVAECVVPTQSLMSAFKNGGSVEARHYWTKKMAGTTKLQHMIAKINQGLIDPSIGERNACSLDHDDVMEG